MREVVEMILVLLVATLACGALFAWCMVLPTIGLLYMIGYLG